MAQKFLGHHRFDGLLVMAHHLLVTFWFKLSSTNFYVSLKKCVL